MPPRIAIPLPHSTDHEYSQRALPQYERAVEVVGGEPIRIPLDLKPAELRTLVEGCEGVLLPGSNADVDPARFRQEKSARTAAADLLREAVDDFLLEHAYARCKPVLAICYGLQSLNIFRKGSLIQHIPDFLPQETRTKVNHEAGKSVAVAHTVSIETNSKLGHILRAYEPQRTRRDTKENRGGHGFSRDHGDRPKDGALAPEGATPIVPVNSSHHQSAEIIGDDLAVVARCPDDQIIEALEGTPADHFVVAVQWHPERSVDDDNFSKAIFRALVEAAR